MFEPSSFPTSPRVDARSSSRRTRARRVPLRLKLVLGLTAKGRQRVQVRCRHPRTQQVGPTVTMYQVTDLLHAEHSVEVSCHDLAATVSTWLAELGAQTALVDDLARAICAGDWPTAYAIGDRLSVDVSVAA